MFAFLHYQTPENIDLYFLVVQQLSPKILVRNSLINFGQDLTNELISIWYALFVFLTFFLGIFQWWGSNIEWEGVMLSDVEHCYFFWRFKSPFWRVTEHITYGDWGLCFQSSVAFSCGWSGSWDFVSGMYIQRYRVSAYAALLRVKLSKSYLISFI